jgi:hypothetical protein
MKPTYNTNYELFGIVRSVKSSGLIVSILTGKSELIGDIMDKRILNKLSLGDTFECYINRNKINILGKDYNFIPISERR